MGGCVFKKKKPGRVCTRGKFPQLGSLSDSVVSAPHAHVPEWTWQYSRGPHRALPGSHVASPAGLLKAQSVAARTLQLRIQRAGDPAPVELPLRLVQATPLPSVNLPTLGPLGQG